MSRANPRFRRVNPVLTAAPANTFEVTLFGSIENQLTINTFYYRDQGAALTSLSESNLSTGFAASVLGAFAACCSADWSYNQIKVQCLTTPARQPYLGVSSGPGTGPSTHEPTTVCGVIIRRTGIKGQSGRGRIAVPAPSTSLVTSSSLSAGLITTYNALCVAMVTPFTAGGVTWTPGVVSRKNKAGPPLGYADLTSCQTRTLLGTCRRRKVGRGK